MAKGDGEKIAIRFTEPLLGDVSGNESSFTVSFQEYEFVPNGELRYVEREVIRVSGSTTDPNVIYLHLAPGNQNNIQNAAGDVTVSYSGGRLIGEGGPVEAFSESFTPEELIFKGNQNDAEHIEVQISASGILKQIDYIDGFEKEHIEIQVSATCQLIDIRDI